MSSKPIQRYSKQRECILKVLESTVTHPNANWIYNNVREEIPNVSLGTVYRNLSRLCDEGMILKIDIGDGVERYDACIKPHYHLSCKRCGRVCDISAEYDSSVDKMAESENHCSIDYHSLIFWGTCPECTKEK